MSDYVIDETLQEGIFNGYRLIFERKNFLKHQEDKSKNWKWWYQASGCGRFLEKLIVEVFKKSDCECPSNHNKRWERCIYGIYQDNGDYKTYLKIPFLINKKKKIITVATYSVVPNISEILCKQKMQKK